MFLPESDWTIEGRLFLEVTCQMSELKDVTVNLIQARDKVSGTMRQEIDNRL